MCFFTLWMLSFHFMETILWDDNMWKALWLSACSHLPQFCDGQQCRAGRGRLQHLFWSRSRAHQNFSQTELLPRGRRSFQLAQVPSVLAFLKGTVSCVSVCFCQSFSSLFPSYHALNANWFLTSRHIAPAGVGMVSCCRRQPPSFCRWGQGKAAPCIWQNHPGSPAVTPDSSLNPGQHFPLYRRSDANCSGEDAAPPEERGIPFKERYDVLSQEASQKVWQCTGG